MKKVFLIALDILLIAYMVFALGFSGSRESELLCRELKIQMKDSLHAGFLKKEDIEKLILNSDEAILGYPLSGINIRRLEAKLRELPYVRKAELYSSLDGVLYADIHQRKPVIRIITRSQNTYYIDKEGYIFPSYKDFTPHILIANGYFSEGKELKGVRNVGELKDHDAYHEWIEALDLARYLMSSKLWKPQIVQLYYNRSGDFELIPRVGAHQIIFGRGEDIEGKFGKLKILYEEGLKYEGWNTYEKINLKYDNQVICTKR
ncbi:MAG: hypothetical protein IH594_17615 [Bacteroidales bacterium]|nr:hypothetical protein [Bacteroidales bacterium]